MTWKCVHLDHIQPLSSFDLTDNKQLKTAANYINIQPLFKKDNLIKRNRFHDYDLLVQRNNVYEYEYYKYYCL